MDNFYVKSIGIMLYVHLYVKYLQTFLGVVYGLIDYTNKECAEVMFYIQPLCDICIHMFCFC